MTTRQGNFDDLYNRRSGHQASKNATSQCHICRRRLRVGEHAIIVGEGYSPKRYHRSCLKHILNWSYEIAPANGLEVVESEVGVDPTGKLTFNAYRDKILEKLEDGDGTDLELGEEG